MFVVLPLLLLLLGSSPSALAAADEHEEFTVLDLSSLKPHAACSGHRVTPPHNGSWVPLYHPLGPCSPSYRGAAAAAPSLADLLRQDRLRAHHIHSKVFGDFRASKGSYKEPVAVEETQVHHQAAITIEMGTQSTSSQMHGSHSELRIGPAATGDGTSGPPPVSQTVVLDTASDVPWVDCVPCALAECPYYDPARSSSYAAFPCNSSACKQLGPYANGCANNQCQYRVAYSDGSSSSGTYSSDLLTISSGDTVRNFRFGCNQASSSGGGATNGFMALGRGAQSLTAQTSSIYGNAFSYCFPPRESEKGFFRIGVPGGAGYRFAMTPMLRDRRAPALYRALLVAITVNGQPLNVAPEVFAAGAVLDSRTVITRLPLTVYGALRAAFRDKMAAYRRAPPQPEVALDTCYDFTGVRYVRLPRVALVFDRNAVVELDRSGILFGDCLAFTANDDDSMPAILGNTQQQTIEVLHDVGGGNIGFRRQAC
ncbi:hypothetical protein PAHAL_4G346900 [Panicum hallii]|uniref:Peptidase A1 domain-containing protein n=1 Tax=Panicum hallii TaxID=206008 RepID=A0A2S3HMA0_9POAL|nr:aspartyl protease family protein At5g10770-like [Panicum hallii]PAN26089.1 hypothetical protein PAHAL_4G346900 [Panicum hallii]